ncbi:metallophosphoesterase [Salegentibacter sp. F188]|uniref:acid phosphatase n=1 Tax=Autumnicola patrickiae TaxID=3075591 RepID=A0ABU3E309_9FLAO|nr:metallophosphoesterase [Salegentibacter sp. F188]MDT0690315.1 metallophosphoesterase [Salegentibacter sp. F188]
MNVEKKVPQTLQVIRAVGILFAFILSATFSQAQTRKIYNANKTQALEELTVKEGGLSFYVIGDWGRNGHFKQMEIAAIMQQAGFIIKPDFIISTGDNFYPDGIASVKDPFIISSFEDIYYGSNLFCPWYLVLGNHGYLGNVEAQIDYTKISQRWNMPNHYYLVDKEVDDFKTRLIFLDTNPLQQSYYEEEKYRKIKEQDTLQQKRWLLNALETSEAKWNIVVGHHPMYSAGKDQEETSLQNLLESTSKDSKVDIVFSGHQHVIAHQKSDESTIQQFISGSGSRGEDVGKSSSTKFIDSDEGFLIVIVQEKEILVQAVNWKGEVLYKREIFR